MVAGGHSITYVCPHDRDEQREGVTILGVPAPKNGRDRLLYTTRSVLKRAAELDPDAILHLHDSDLLPGGLLLKARGRTVVYDAHEDTPKQMRYQHWLPHAIRPAAGWTFRVLEALAGKRFDGIIAAEPENARRFPSERTVVIHNYPDLSELPSAPALAYEERDAVVLYIGAITEVRGLWEMVRASEHLSEDLQARLVLGGPFHPSSLEPRVRALESPEVLGYLERPQVTDWLGRARVGLVVLHPTEKYLESYPTKLFEYMAAGIPVVASNFPQWKQIVEDAGCGISVDPLDVEAIASAIEWLLRNPRDAQEMGERGRRAVSEKYAWSKEAEKLVAFYDELTLHKESTE